jgi:hypothetical protein
MSGRSIKHGVEYLEMCERMFTVKNEMICQLSIVSMILFEVLKMSMNFKSHCTNNR